MSAPTCRTCPHGFRNRGNPVELHMCGYPAGGRWARLVDMYLAGHKNECPGHNDHAALEAVLLRAARRERDGKSNTH